MPTVEPVRRTPEIEEFTNRWLIHPLAARLVPCFAAMRVSANVVSLAGMTCGLLAGFAYYHYADRWYALAGFALMIAWHVLDGADGQLARLTRTQSELGKVLDGICDYVTFIAVYVALAAAMRPAFGVRAWALVAVAGACHALQAAAYEATREDYRSFASEPTPLPSGTARGGASDRASARGLRRVFARLDAYYQRVQRELAGGHARYRRRLTDVLDHSPGREASIRAGYRASFAPAVRRWSVLSSNYRTFGLFLGAWFQAPAAFFEVEILGLSAVLAILSVDQRLRYVRFLRRIEDACASR